MPLNTITQWMYDILSHVQQGLSLPKHVTNEQLAHLIDDGMVELCTQEEHQKCLKRSARLISRHYDEVRALEQEKPSLRRWFLLLQKRTALVRLSNLQKDFIEAIDTPMSFNPRGRLYLSAKGKRYLRVLENKKMKYEG